MNNMNLKTEDEARECWCPLTQCCVGPSDDFYTNHIGGGHLCIASDCMAWRWAYTPVYSHSNIVVDRKKTDKGFCGLAGKEPSQ